VFPPSPLPKKVTTIIETIAQGQLHVKLKNERKKNISPNPMRLNYIMGAGRESRGSPFSLSLSHIKYVSSFIERAVDESLR